MARRAGRRRGAPADRARPPRRRPAAARRARPPLGLARRKAGDLPDAAAERLDGAAEQAQLASGELRELARGLHPAGLSERGLRVALEALAARSPLEVRLAALPERRLPEPVELTIYYLVAEALTNAQKYAGAARVDIPWPSRRPRPSPPSATTAAGARCRVRHRPARPRRPAPRAGRHARRRQPGGRRDELTATVPLAPWRDAREPFLEFGHEGDDGLGEHLIGEILAGRKTVTVSLMRECELEGGAPASASSPDLDHHGHRRAVVEVTRVAVMPFDEIDEAVVTAESAGARSVAEWRGQQRAFYDRCRDEIAMLIGEPGWRLTEEEPMIICSIRLVGDDDDDAGR